METVNEVPSWYNHCLNFLFGFLMILGMIFLVIGSAIVGWAETNIVGEKPISHKDEVFAP